MEDGTKFRVIKKGEEKSDGEEVVAVAYERTIVCGHCGFEMASVFITDALGKDDIEKQADSLIKDGWSHINGELSCPSCTKKLLRPKSVKWRRRKG